MNPQSPDVCDLYEVAAEFIIDEGEHDIAEAPQISSGGDVTEHSDSQRLLHCPKQEDDLQVSKGPSSDIHCPKQEDMQVSKGPSSDIHCPKQEEDMQVSKGPSSDIHCPKQEEDLQVSKGPSSDIHCPKQEDDLQVSKGPSSDIHCPKQEEDLQVSKGPSSDILTSQQQEDEHGDQKSFVKDRKETSTPSQNPQDQQQQQPPPVERLCSDHPPLEENLGKIMAEDLLEHQIVNHEGKPSEEAGPASDFHSSNDIESTEALRPLNPEAEEKNSAEKVIPGENDDKRAIGSSHNRNPKRFFCGTKTLLCVVVSTFALIIVAKLLPRRSEMHGSNMQKKRRAAMRK